MRCWERGWEVRGGERREREEGAREGVGVGEGLEARVSLTLPAVEGREAMPGAWVSTVLTTPCTTGAPRRRCHGRQHGRRVGLQYTSVLACTMAGQLTRRPGRCPPGSGSSSGWPGAGWPSCPPSPAHPPHRTAPHRLSVRLIGT